MDQAQQGTRMCTEAGVGLGEVWGLGKSWANALSVGPEETPVKREQKYSWTRKTEGLGS